MQHHLHTIIWPIPPPAASYMCRACKAAVQQRGSRMARRQPRRAAAAGPSGAPESLAAAAQSNRRVRRRMGAPGSAPNDLFCVCQVRWHRY